MLRNLCPSCCAGSQEKASGSTEFNQCLLSMEHFSSTSKSVDIVGGSFIFLLSPLGQRQSCLIKQEHFPAGEGIHLILVHELKDILNGKQYSFFFHFGYTMRQLTILGLQSFVCGETKLSLSYHLQDQRSLCLLCPCRNPIGKSAYRIIGVLKFSLQIFCLLFRQSSLISWPLN